jgi:hypothetical protein
MNTQSPQFQPLFSIKEDLQVFAGPVCVAGLVILGLTLGSEYLSAYIPKEKGELWFLRIYLTFIGFPHIWATFHKFKIDRTLSSPAIAYRWEMKIFWLLLALAAGVAFYSGGLLARLISYADIFHHVRQQQGWLGLSQKRQASLGRGENILDNIMIYNVTLAPLIWWHANPTSFGWFSGSDLVFFLPEWAGGAALAVHWAITSIFIGTYLYWYLKHRSFNLGKLLIILNTWVVFYVGILFLRDGMKNLLIIFNHSIPYLFLVFRYFNKHRTPLRPGFLHSNFFRFYSPLLAGGALVAATQFMTASWLPNLAKGILFFWLGVSLFHYYFDAFIWRVRKKESTMKEFFHFQLKPHVSP